MSREDPEEQHPGLGGVEYVLYQISIILMKVLGRLLKVVTMMVFPSLWLYRRKGGLWTRITGGFWPVLYAGYFAGLVVLLSALWPELATLVGVKWLTIFGGTFGMFIVVTGLTFGHRLAFFRVPGGSLIRWMSPTESPEKEEDRAVFPADEVHDRSDDAAPVPNTKSDWHALFAGISGVGKTVTMQRYVNQIYLGGDDYAIICYDEDGEFQPHLAERGYETLVFNPRNPEVIPDIMSCIEHPDDLDSVAEALVSGTSDKNTKFAPGAKTVLNGGLRLLWERLGTNVTNDMIYEFFSREPDEIYEELAAAGYEQYAGPIRDSESGQSPHMTVINTAMNKGLRGKLKEPGSFDLSSWVQNPGNKALVIETGRDKMDAAGPALRLIIDLVLYEGFRNPEGSAFLLADEVDELPGSSMIGEVAARGRGKDCYAVIGVQTKTQLENNFGEGPAEQIVSNMGQYFMFNPGTCDGSWNTIKRLIGEERKREYTKNQSRTSQRMTEKDRHTAGTSEQIKERCPLSDADIANMERGECIVVNFSREWWFAKLTEPDWAK